MIGAEGRVSPDTPGALEGLQERAGDWLPQANALVDALLAADRETANWLLRGALTAGVPYTTTCVHLVESAMYRVGELWEAGRCTVAQEQVATAVCQTVIARALMDCEAREPNGRRMLFACVPGNQHGLGARIVADAFELDGYEVEFTGADTPIDALVHALNSTKPDLVGLSVALPEQRAAARRCIAAIREACGKRAPSVAVGGYGLRESRRPAESVGADLYFRDVEQAVRTLA